MIEKPIPQSYWVIPESFLAGEYPAVRYDEAGTRSRLASFIDQGFEVFLDLTCEGERPAYSHLLMEEAGRAGREASHQRFSFPDFSIPDRGSMLAVLDAIDAALVEGRRVYLHCVGGIGRTGTTVGCFLIRHGLQPEEALQRLRRLYRTSAQSRLATNSPEADEQVRFILDWHEH